MGDLGLTIVAAGDELHGTAQVLPTMWSPGTTSLRASLLLTWADTLLGLLALRVLAPRVPVTLDIDVQLFETIEGTTTVDMVGRVTKVGSSAQVFSIDFLSASGRRVGFGHSVFMAAPDPNLSVPTGDWALARFNSRRGTLLEPLAQRIGCVRTGPGEVRLPNGPHMSNASDTLNGGLLAIAVEEAALSAVDVPTTLTSLQVRFLRPVRGDAVARAVVQDGLGEVEVHDSRSDALSIIATTRSVRR